MAILYSKDLTKVCIVGIEDEKFPLKSKVISILQNIRMVKFRKISNTVLIVKNTYITDKNI